MLNEGLKLGMGDCIYLVRWDSVQSTAKVAQIFY